MKMSFESGAKFAREQDAADPLKEFRKAFIFPKGDGTKAWTYLAGNSLGLQPKKARLYVDQELRDWAKLGVEGHVHAKSPWLPYHENLTAQTARLVGAKPGEVVVMNTLTVNLHLMMVSFYRPTAKRFKILMEASAFPSDQYAVASQVRYHGFEPDTAIIAMKPRPGEQTLRTEDIEARLAADGESIALVLFGSVNYLTGQAFDIPAITAAGHAQGCLVGFDLAHGAGNVPLRLHDWGPDFAVWCSYKYLNGGPGALAGCFVHARHAQADLPRFAGWWGHDKKSRFKMPEGFIPISGAEGWQLSNPPIFSMAALRASMDLFEAATTAALRRKSERLTGYLEYLLDALPPGFCQVITPRQPQARGAQLSLRLARPPKTLLKKLSAAGVICDFREPDIIRAAPAPLYNSFSDVHRFVTILEQHAKH